VTRILVVTHYFPPEVGAPQARLSELAAAWAEAGDEVTVLTGMPNHPTGVKPPSYRRKLRLEERTGGYRVVRTWLYATPNDGVVLKTFGHLSFMVTSVVLGWPVLGGIDVVVVSSPTFFSIFPAWLIARVRRVPLVIEVRDLWPAIFEELGVLTNRRLLRRLERVELWLYHSAAAVILVTDGFRDNLIGRGVDPAKLHVIKNGVDPERFRPQAADPTTREWLGASREVVLALYIGAHGISQGLTTVVDAAAKLSGQPIHFAFVGDGAARADLVQRVEELGTANVTLLPGVERRQVAGMIAAADICLVTLRDIPLFSTFIPSKIFEYLAMGKPVVAAVRGEAAAIVTAAGSVVVPPEDPDALATAVGRLAADPSLRASMGRSGRRLVEEEFDRRRLADGYRQLLCDLRSSGVR
jgi:glycosyltransferase involved in cell wall biosynthesis